MSSVAYEFPWQFSFPPFFTLQTHEETRRKQLDAWCQLITSYCKHQNIFILTYPDCQEQLPFCNKSLNRRLSVDAVIVVLEELKRRNQLIWLENSNTKKNCLVLWRSIDEWARMLSDSIRQRGSLNTVCTLYELTDGHDAHTEFKNIPQSLLLEIIHQLEKQGKAALVGKEGVKFSL